MQSRYREIIKAFSKAMQWYLTPALRLLHVPVSRCSTTILHLITSINPYLSGIRKSCVLAGILPLRLHCHLPFTLIAETDPTSTRSPASHIRTRTAHYNHPDRLPRTKLRSLNALPPLLVRMRKEIGPRCFLHPCTNTTASAALYNILCHTMLNCRSFFGTASHPIISYHTSMCPRGPSFPSSKRGRISIHQRR